MTKQASTNWIFDSIPDRKKAIELLKLAKQIEAEKTKTKSKTK